MCEKWKNGTMEKFIRGIPPESIFPFFYFFQMSLKRIIWFLNPFQNFRTELRGGAVCPSRRPSQVSRAAVFGGLLLLHGLCAPFRPIRFC
jgi:hypothetical protein